MKSAPIGRFAILAGLGAAALLGLNGCMRPHAHHWRGRPLVVGDRLDCPETQGRLTRVSASPDGNTCEYRREDGEQITLVRLPLNGQSPQDGLASIEASLKPLLPPRGPAPSSPSVDAGADDKDTAHIDVPGVHIDAHGDKAEVRVMGVTIDADNDKANVNAGLGSNKAIVSADKGGAEVRATEVNKVNANLVLILASEKPGPSGFRAVGYIARGPTSGPLVVAEFKSIEHQQGISDDHDLRKLMERNVRR
ncbi:MAG TPA: hypothetical protein VHY34_03585 [Caulobacteraceae bacterium]|jgi:hypothetical protein|nr:hypothetical protein [Caulobacteraceae bacterium]